MMFEVPHSTDSTYCPTERELDDLDVLLSGGYAPQVTFDNIVSIATSGPIDLVDPEGVPIGHLDTTGRIHPLEPPAYGAFRRLFLNTADVAEKHPNALTVVTVAAPTNSDIAQIEEIRGERRVVFLALCGRGTPQGLSRNGLIRACLAAASIIPDASVVAVPLPSHGDSELDHALGRRVVHAFAPGDVLALRGEGPSPVEVAAVVASDRPDPRGLVVFFTGLSGSGKSTVARALNDAILEAGARTVTRLDGDVVRKNLSTGLTFSRDDRETNIRRIGWVAAEIARHGGLAICSPIAPFDETRQAVRAMVTEVGAEFVLIHIATPLEECERRDRKGLYAKARAGEIPDFTGITSPYEEPTDADLVLDTTDLTVEKALDQVLAVLPLNDIKEYGT